MEAEANKAVIRRLIEEVYNEDNLDVVDELVAPDIFNHAAVPEHQHGIDGFKHVMEWVREFSSDVHYDIDDIISEGDKVAELWAVRDDLTRLEQLGLIPVLGES